MVVHFQDWVNTYGSFTAYFVGLFLRLGGGEPLINLPALIEYPLYDEISGQLFPIRTFAMVMSMTTLIGVSQLTRYFIIHPCIDKYTIKPDNYVCTSLQLLK